MEMRNAYQILLGKPEEKRQLWRTAMILTWNTNMSFGFRWLIIWSDNGFIENTAMKHAVS
jgi:hypothetical protein